MISIIANSGIEYHALEYLFDMTGILTNKKLNFRVANQYFIDNNDINVIFIKNELHLNFPKNIRYNNEGNNLFINTDIIDSIIDSLSQRDEFYLTKNTNNIKVENFYASKQINTTTAFLDNLVNIFRKIFIEFLSNLEITWWQELPSKKPIVCLTHDVDSIKGKSVLRYFYWLLMGLKSFNWDKIGDTLDKIKTYISLENDPDFSMDLYCNIEDKYNFKSTFYMLSLPFFIGKEGRRYAIKNHKLIDELKNISRRGWEIGLHPSRKTTLSRRKLEKEVNRLIGLLNIQNYNLGVRNHYLKAIYPETWRLQESLGFKYDSSLGFTMIPGFRAGTSKPFQPFDIENNRRINIWELPLIAMDGTLKGTADEITNQLIELAEESFRHNSPFTLLWHTNRISPIEYPEHSKAYYNILQYFKERDCIGLPATKVIDIYCSYYHRMSLQRRKGNL